MTKKTPQPSIKQLILVALVLGIVLCLILEIMPVEPVNLTEKNITEPLIELIGAKYSNTSYSPYSIRMNSTDIYIIGALPRKKGYGYKRYNLHVKNYFNGEYNCLQYEQTNQGVGTYYYPIEGLFFYNNSSSILFDVDFDLVSGFSGDYNNKYRLNIVNRSLMTCKSL